MFSLPIKTTGGLITSAAQGLGILDRSGSTGLNESTFNSYVSNFGHLIVSEDALTSLLTMQRVNNEVMNLIVAW